VIARRAPRSLSVLAATTAMLLLIAAVVFGLGDRTALVPAPEVVAEGLMRQLATHRPRQTAQYVSDSAQPPLTPQALRAWFEPIERRIGPVQQARGERALIDGDTAQAFVLLTGDRYSMRCLLTLVRHQGLWAVTAITAL
jgi:hypothetical protein